MQPIRPERQVPKPHSPVFDPGSRVWFLAPAGRRPAKPHRQSLCLDCTASGFQSMPVLQKWLPPADPEVRQVHQGQDFFVAKSQEQVLQLPKDGLRSFPAVATPPVLHYCSANDQPRWMNLPESQRFSSAWRQNQIFFRTSKPGKPSRAFPLDQGGKAFVDQFPEPLLTRQVFRSCDKIVVKRYGSPHESILFASKTASYYAISYESSSGNTRHPRHRPVCFWRRAP